MYKSLKKSFVTHSAKTAISRKGPSRPVQNFYSEYSQYIKKDTTVLDYGCGKGADIRWLISKDVDAMGYDPNYVIGGLRKKYKYVLCTYVLNVIQPKIDKMRAIKHLFSLLALNGTAYITVRANEEIDKAAKAKSWLVSGDGYYTTSGTYQEGFDGPELMGLLIEAIRDDIDYSKFLVMYNVLHTTKNYVTIALVKCPKIIDR